MPSPSRAHPPTVQQSPDDTGSPAVPSWRPALSGALQERAIACARAVGLRLADQERVHAAAAEATRRSHRFEFAGPSLACGFPSIAMVLLHLTRALPGEGWEQRLHTALGLSARSTAQSPLHGPGLYGGTSGLALVLAGAAETEPRYAPSAGKVHAALLGQVTAGPWALKDAEPRGTYTKDHLYDVVTGASGVLGALLATGAEDAASQEATELLIRYLTGVADAGGNGTGRLLSPADAVDPALLEECPQGYFDLGTAHGAAGPLAALALACRAGYRVPGQLQAVRALTDWLVDHRVQDPWGVNWPNHMGLHDPPGRGAAIDRPPSRAGWCYGAPGIAMALWHAGHALDAPEPRRLAVEAVQSVLRRPAAERHIPSPSLCHGVAGLLTVCLRLAQEEPGSPGPDAPNSLIQEHIPVLTEQILGLFDPEAPLCFRDEEQPGVFVDDPGFLTGAAGVALALLAAATPVAPSWDRALLMS
ncbi:lanthionine synthetase C family protein [Streptomyces sp. NPDC047525]|uniref:lanthionine synthetase C family protein n=1 Tax=Streptomyces sp. NPDC047525 TaxID=3155264 RepID=UPI0033FBC7BD